MGDLQQWTRISPLNEQYLRLPPRGFAQMSSDAQKTAGGPLRDPLVSAAL